MALTSPGQEGKKRRLPCLEETLKIDVQIPIAGGWRFLLFLSILFVPIPGTSGQALGAPQEKACLKTLRPLEQKKFSVSDLGGVWSLFEQSRQLRPDSTLALQLDHKVSKLLEDLKYLCTTLNGVPLNDLAEYLDRNLRIKSEQQFRKELAILGKSKDEVQIWIEFYNFARTHMDRKLDEQSVQSTIQKASGFFDRYVKFSDDIGQGTKDKTVQDARKIIDDIQSFIQSDLNLSKAEHEMAQVPYWDFDENHGGS